MARLSKLSRSISDKIALVTGAASGMGRATAHLFADEGAHVAVTDLDQGKVDVVVQEITAAGGSAAGYVLDVASDSDRRRVVAAIVERWGGLDILVNNAGIAIERPIEAEDFAAVWVRTFDVLLTAQVLLIRECLPRPRASARPRVSAPIPRRKPG